MEEIKQRKRGQNLYIVEASLEYFIAIIIGGAYLAKITEALGMSQGLTGILTAFVSLGYVFQIFALFLAGKRKVKGFITVMHTVNQVCFAIIYLIPLIPIPTIVKHVFFIVFLLAGHIISNLIGSPKIGWYMTFVEEKERGSFTAKKEITSLLGGMIFSYLVSFVIDYFEATGQLTVAFAISAVAIFVLAIAHTFTLIGTPQHELPVSNDSNNFLLAAKTVFSNKRVRHVLVVAVLYNLTTTTVTAFYGAYTAGAKENFGLGFSMTFIAILSIVHSLARVAASRPMGRFADKYSFKTMGTFCYALLGLSFAVNVFTTPTNGSVMYTIYYVIHAVALAGTNSCIINLLYEEVKPELRMSALAVQYTVSGLIGFLGAIVAGVFVDAVQANVGGTMLGLYAQQWLSVWGVFLCVMLVAYISIFMKKKKGFKRKQALQGNQDLQEE